MKFRLGSRLLLIALLAIGLIGCSNIVDVVNQLPENRDLSFIGPNSGTGELVSSGNDTFEASEFESIEVSADAMAIYVTRSINNKAEVELLIDNSIDNHFTYKASISSNTLKIDVDEATNTFDFAKSNQKGERKLLISLPEKLYKKVNISNEIGIIEAAELQANSVKINSDVGTIRLSEVAGEMNLTIDVGEITVDGFLLDNDLSIKAEVGEVMVHLNEAPEAAAINLTSEIGEVTAELDHIDFSKNSTNKKMGTIGTDGPRLDIQTEVGSILVDIK